jgi:hypothetical protein
MRSINRLFLGCFLFTGCAANLENHPPLADKAQAEERLACGNAPIDEDPRVLSPQAIEGVSPLIVGEPALKAATRERVVGAQLRLGAQPGLTAEWIQRSLECHASRQLLRTAPAVENDPYWLPDAWVAVSVTSQGDAFIVSLRGESPEVGERILDRAHAFARAR